MYVCMYVCAIAIVVAHIQDAKAVALEMQSNCSCSRHNMCNYIPNQSNNFSDFGRRSGQKARPFTEEPEEPLADSSLG